MIGDKLQSILCPENIYTHIEKKKMPNVKICKSTPKNKVRRFHNKGLAVFVNDVVPFEKFDLPSICGICDGNTCEFKHDDEPCLEVFDVPQYNCDYTHALPTVAEIMTR